jgi:hypothetical protein
MAIPDPFLPYGLREVKLTPLGVGGATPGTAVKLPIARTFEFKDTEDFNQLRGDDGVAASHGSGCVVNWSLESGGISFEAYATIAGGTVTTTGLTPSIVKTYSKKTTDARPYFKVEGRALGDTGGDVHGLVYRCKATGDIGGTWGDGEFFLTSADGEGYGSLESGKTDKAYDFIGNETATAIA